MTKYLHQLFWFVLNHTYKLWPDALWLKTIYKVRFKKKLDLKNPQTFNEKLNWLKLYDRNPLYTTLVDKHEVKAYVTNLIGKEYVVPCYGVWNHFDEIDFQQLPESFILKCTHDSGGRYVCRCKDQMDKKVARQVLERTMHNNFFWWTREWVYKDVKPRIIADMLLDDHTGSALRDYKFWCFNGIPRYMYCTIKNDDIYENFYDMDFNAVDINHGFRRMKPEFEKPACFNLMKTLAERLSAGIPFVRVDFFQVNGKVYFGEYTFYDWAGLRPFCTDSLDFKLGKLINIPLKDKKLFR